MGMTTNYKQFSLNAMFRGTGGAVGGKTLSWSGAPTLHVALIGGEDFPAQGVAQRSTAYQVGDYAWPKVLNGRLYRCTTAGTTGAAEPTWPTGDGGTVTDGTVVWTEQTLAMDNGDIPEPDATGYARQAIQCTTANMTLTGTSVSNAQRIEFPLAEEDWGPVWGIALFDAATGGNAWAFFPMGAPKVVGESDRIDFAAGTITISSYA